jgi:hypothetical protein
MGAQQGGKMSRDNRNNDPPEERGGKIFSEEDAQQGDSGSLNEDQRAGGERRSYKEASSSSSSSYDQQGSFTPPPSPLRPVIREPVEIEEEEEEPDYEKRCIIVGPSQSGKTFLLLAIGRSCFMPNEDGFELEFIPDESVSELMEKSVNIITGKDNTRKGSTRSQDYSFEIHAKAMIPASWGRKRTVQETVFLTVSDGPGGSLFPEEGNTSDEQKAIKDWQPHMEKEARRANTFVLCVDASDPDLTYSDLLEMYLPGLIARISKVRRHIEEAPNGGGIFSRFRKNHQNQMVRYKRSLKADRFLLLLNKVDNLCAPFSNPNKAAEMIDPVEQAREMLGVALLNQIKHALKPDAAFAVGVTSALGFHPFSGRPIADERGIVGMGQAQQDGNILRNWTPFGIRDALLFIATGHATGSVKLVTQRDLYHDRKDRAVPVEPANVEFAREEENHDATGSETKS